MNKEILSNDNYKKVWETPSLDNLKVIMTFGGSGDDEDGFGGPTNNDN